MPSLKVKIDVRGIEKVQERLGKRAANDLVDAIDTDLGVEARKMAVEGAKGSPVLTGALRASILTSPGREGKLKYYWGSRLPYALRQEYEHRPRAGWLRRSWEIGKRSTEGTIVLTIKKRLGG